MESISQTFGMDWPLFVAQLMNLGVVAGLFVWAVCWIMKEGSGWEVPAWLLPAFFIPVPFPIISIIYFRPGHRWDSTAPRKR